MTAQPPFIDCESISEYWLFWIQLHKSQSDPDTPILEHVQELLGTLDALGITPSPIQDDEEGDGDGWEDASDDEDIEMS